MAPEMMDQAMHLKRVLERSSRMVSELMDQAMHLNRVLTLLELQYMSNCIFEARNQIGLASGSIQALIPECR